MALIQQMAHKKRLFFLIIAIFLMIPLNLMAESIKPAEVFQKITQAFNTVDFKGKLMFISYGPEESPVREAMVIKEAPDKKRIEFIWPSEMVGTGMVMNGEERWPIRREEDRNRERDRRSNFPPRSRRPPPGPPPPDGMMEDFASKNVRFLLKNYNVRILSGGHVAGRDTYLLELESKISPRPSRKLWIDKDKGVILKMENYDSQKRLRGFFAYSEINYSPDIDDSLFKDDRPKILGVFRQRAERGRVELWNNEGGPLNSEKITKEAGLNVVIPMEIPSGFVIESVNLLKFGEQKTIHLRYTDGLAIVSVFQSTEGERRPFDRPGEPPERRQGPEKPQEKRPEPEKIKIKGINCQIIPAGPMLVFRWNNNINFTLMGEMGRKEMIKMVEAFF